MDKGARPTVALAYTNAIAESDNGLAKIETGKRADDMRPGGCVAKQTLPTEMQGLPPGCVAFARSCVSSYPYSPIYPLGRGKTGEGVKVSLTV